MKASDAKQFIGKLVSYEKSEWSRPRFAVVQEVTGRNIITEDDALWAPDIHSMQLVEPQPGPVE